MTEFLHPEKDSNTHLMRFLQKLHELTYIKHIDQYLRASLGLAIVNVAVINLFLSS